MSNAETRGYRIKFGIIIDSYVYTITLKERQWSGTKTINFTSHSQNKREGSTHTNL